MGTPSRPFVLPGTERILPVTFRSQSGKVPCEPGIHVWRSFKQKAEKSRTKLGFYPRRTTGGRRDYWNPSSPAAAADEQCQGQSKPDDLLEQPETD